jgi:acyl carrier protein
MEKVRIRKIIEDIIITQFLNSEMDIVHEEDVTFKELGLDSIDRIELDAMVEQKFNIVIIDYDTESIKDMTDLVYKIITEGYGK